VVFDGSAREQVLPTSDLKTASTGGTVNVKAVLVAATATTLGLSLTACSGGFSGACKTNINMAIDLRAQASQLSGGAGAPCAGVDQSDALAQACTALTAATNDLRSTCGDSYSKALDAALLGNRQ
jgi:hypothetical protein